MLTKDGPLIAVLLGALTLSACGKNTIIKEDLAKWSADAAVVVAQQRQQINALQAAKTDFHLRVIADGQHCSYEDPTVFVLEPNKPVRCLAPNERPGLDDRTPDKLPSGAETVTVRLHDTSKHQTLETIAVLAEFQALVAKIVEDPELKTGERLASFVERACSLSGKFGEFGGKGIKECTPEPTPEDGASDTGTTPKVEAPAEASPASGNASVPFGDERDAIVAVVNLAKAAREDRRDLEQLRKAYAKYGPALSNTLSLLLKRYRDKDAEFKAALDAYAEASARRALRREMAKLDKDDAEGRYKLMHEQYTKERVLRADIPARDPLIVALEGLIKTDAQFQDALLRDNFSPEARDRIARETFSQLKAWFRALQTLTTVF